MGPGIIRTVVILFYDDVAVSTVVVMVCGIVCCCRGNEPSLRDTVGSVTNAMVFYSCRMSEINSVGLIQRMGTLLFSFFYRAIIANKMSKIFKRSFGRNLI